MNNVAPTVAPTIDKHTTIINAVNGMDDVVNELEALHCRILGADRAEDAIPSKQLNPALADVLNIAAPDLLDQRHRMMALIGEIQTALFG